MITSNPFVELATIIPPGVMQAYVVLMVLLVIGGTLLDVKHKKSAQYFFEKGQSLKKLAKREVSSAEKLSIAIGTIKHEVLSSGEFENPDRRKSHLMMMYGFIVFVLTTASMIFGLPAAEGQSWALTSLLWHAGAVSICVGGYWFWFKIRADVRSEGHQWYEVHQSDIFIVSLLLMAGFALIWSLFGLGVIGGIACFFFIAASTTLFSTVLWSKFAHMFFKPAAAFQKKVAKADGSLDKLPELPELTDPVVKERYPDIPEYMGEKPPYMGLGIKREAPNHY
ncbi:adenylyl-sulfate reductase [Rhabdochromatium marinum]|uniref:adenylyl-sulfate reductase n=1 Tax=Rhabdochromatium marinum TaxID=48729 RepID=UPI001904ADB0|nr:adenylyl-sulfate reductase [Rhabdochromatium marinum]MBK1648524.1 adenylyl-sulfate reductase [Rhabdochromatium marinum]